MDESEIKKVTPTRGVGAGVERMIQPRKAVPLTELNSIGIWKLSKPNTVRWALVVLCQKMLNTSGNPAETRDLGAITEYLSAAIVV